MTRRIFTACPDTETNALSPIPTGLPGCQQAMLVRGGRHGEQPNLSAVPLIRWKQQAPAPAAFTAPAGATALTTRNTWRDEILAGLRQALPLDALLLNLHAAMVAERELPARVRRGGP